LLSVCDTIKREDTLRVVKYPNKHRAEIRSGLVTDYDIPDDVCPLRLNRLHRVSYFNSPGIALKAFLTV
jgi:hypothetical protein